MFKAKDGEIIILKSHSKGFTNIYKQSDIVAPLHLCHVRCTRCPREDWELLNEEVDLCDLLGSFAFSVLPQAAVYMDLFMDYNT